MLTTILNSIDMMSKICLLKEVFSQNLWLVKDVLTSTDLEGSPP